ncbi:MAG: tetratricopeptide repeat protein [Clostridiales bacterium]|nr:tetratricopeptide repeat protein [Candidatus Blautia equi]
MLLAGCGEKNKNLYEQAGKDLEQGYYEYALEGYKAVIAEGDLLPQAYRGAGVAYLRMGKYENAVTCFTNALAQDKVSAAVRKDILSYRATAYVHNKQYKKALADCQTLAEEFEMDTAGYYLTGIVTLEMDSYEQARTNFDQAYAGNPTYEMAIRIYQVYVEKGMEADGTKYLEMALLNEPQTADEYCDRGKVYYYMEDYDNARRELTTAANNNNTEALLLLGMVYLGQKDFSNARTMYNEYIAKVGNSAKGYNGLAQCDMHEGKYDEALANIEKGLEIATTEEMQDLLYNEMVIYETRLDFETAKEKTEAYLNLFPDDASMKRELAFLRSRVRKNTEGNVEAPLEAPAEGATEEPQQ